MKKASLIIAILSVFILNQATTFTSNAPHFNEKLSDYGFFEGLMKEQKPAQNVMPYALNAPLFSDYAHKLRFVRLPSNQSVAYNPDSVFQFPKGTAIAKTFYYQNDERNATKGRRLIETRVLLHEENGWIALPYVWNDEQTEATLEVAGGNAAVTWRDEKGVKHDLDYAIPNMNQCKGCHERNGVMTPIGPSARQLNDDFLYAKTTGNQLVSWKNAEILRGLPDALKDVPHQVNYSNTAASLDARARAYLDANCAHCHNKTGPAQTSGLHLDWQTTDSTALGFFKTPVAAGRGSGNLAYDIVPRKPQESILNYRMESLDPGIMMPELGRKMQHVEGVKLIRDWIKSMKN